MPGLDESALNNNGSNKTGWNALSDTVKYVIYAAAGVVALAIIVSVYFLHTCRRLWRLDDDRAVC